MQILTKDEILAQQQTEAEQQRQAELAAYIAERDAARAAARITPDEEE